jgi:hypothetical protein
VTVPDETTQRLRRQPKTHGLLAGEEVSLQSGQPSKGIRDLVSGVHVLKM